MMKILKHNRIGIFTLILCLAMLQIFVPTAKADSDFAIDSSGTLTQYTGSGTVAVIPDGVKTIGASAFAGKPITEVKIPDSVTTIDSSAFYHCSALRTVTMRKGLKTIGSNAFNSCSALQYVALPEGITSIGDKAFYSSGIEFAKMPASLQTLGNSAYYNSKLYAVHLNDGLKTIGKTPFSSCYNLRGVNVPASVTAIGDCLTDDMGSAFTWVRFENDATVIPANPTETWTATTYYGGDPSTLKTKYDAIYAQNNQTKINFKNKSAFRFLNTFAFDTSSLTLQAGDSHTLTLKKAPADATDTRVHYISSNPDIASVDDTGRIQTKKTGSLTIMAAAADGHLATVNVTVKAAEGELFKIDKNGVLLDYYGHDTKITIPDNVKKIAASAFQGKAITQITLGKKVTAIEDGAFKGCTALVSVDTSNAAELDHIGRSAFENCTALTSLSVPASVTAIGDSAFKGCKALKRVTIPADSPVTRIEPATFSGCSQLQSFTLPKKCRTIGDYAFAFTTALSKFTFAKGSALTTIGRSAFASAGLHSLELPEGLQSVDTQAFTSTDALTRIAFPASFKGPANGSFPKLFDINDAHNTSILKQIVFAKGNARYHDFEGSVYEGTTLVYAAPGIKDLRLEKGTTAIGPGVASVHDHLKSVTMSEGVQRIGSAAFANCFEVEKIHLSDSIETIDDAAFLGCESLKEINVPKRLKKIGGLAFYELENLKSIEIPDGVTQINSYAVSGLDNAKHVIYSRRITDVARCGSAFFPNAEELYLPETLKSVGMQGFAAWSKITHLELPVSLKSVGDEAFKSANQLRSVYIPGGTNLGRDVFSLNIGHRITVFTHHPNASITALAKNNNVQLVDLDYQKTTQNNRKVEIQQLENLLTAGNQNHHFVLTVKEKKPDAGESLHLRVSATDNGQTLDKPDAPLKAVIELTPEQEKYAYDVYLKNGNHYTNLTANRLARFIRAELPAFGDIVLVPAGHDPREPLTLLESPNNAWTRQNPVGLRFRVNSNLRNFTSAYLNGTDAAHRIDPKHYALKSGSTILTLDPKYLRTLKPGRHTLFLAFKSDDAYQGGVITTNFNISLTPAHTSIPFQRPTATSVHFPKARSPHTGDANDAAPWLFLLVASALLGGFGCKNLRLKNPKSDASHKK